MYTYSRPRGMAECLPNVSRGVSVRCPFDHRRSGLTLHIAVRVVITALRGYSTRPCGQYTPTVHSIITSSLQYMASSHHHSITTARAGAPFARPADPSSARASPAAREDCGGSRSRCAGGTVRFTTTIARRPRLVDDAEGERAAERSGRRRCAAGRSRAAQSLRRSEP